MADMFSSAARLWESAENAADPVAWSAEHGIHLWSLQRDIARSVAENKYTVVRSANGLGKSFLAADLACWWVSTHPVDDVMVVTTAPSADQVHGVLWEEIRGLHAAAGLPGVVQMTDRWIIGKTLVAQGRKPPDYNPTALLGTHATYVFVIVDEACGVPQWIWDTIERITTGDKCRLLAIGNPDDPNSEFRHLFEGDIWNPFKISAFDSPNLTGEEIPEGLRGKLTSKNWVEARKTSWGENNPLYISGVLGEFPVESAWSVIRVADLYACRSAALLDIPRRADELLPVELGVDVGGGSDETVIRERCGIKAGREWRDISDRPETLARLVVHAINTTGATSVKIDSIGIGHGLVGELRNLRELGHHEAKIHGVNVSEKARRPDLYFNLRSQLWWEVGRLAAESRAWDLSGMENADATIAQLLEPRYEHDLKGRVKVELKDEIRKRTSRSPDSADALLLAYYEPAHFATEWFEQLMGVAA